MQNNLNVPNFDELNSSNNSLHETTVAGLNEIEPNLAEENTSTDSQINEIQNNNSEILNTNTNEIIFEKKKPNFIEKKEYFAKYNVKAEDTSDKLIFEHFLSKKPRNINPAYFGIDKLPQVKNNFYKSKNFISKKEIEDKKIEAENKKMQEEKKEPKEMNVPKKNKEEKIENNYKTILSKLVLEKVIRYGFQDIVIYRNNYDSSLHTVIYGLPRIYFPSIFSQVIYNKYPASN